jgi:exosortase/archaeosortase family protein
LVPLLQVVTAQLSMALLGLAGIPAHMEGVFITTPGGYFEVAEACSGVKFLVAMLALGVLIAHVGFRSWPRRLAFVATALIVPVLANGVRAFATILVAAETSNAAASGFDHVVYGWFFFGFRDRDRDGIWRGASSTARRTRRWQVRAPVRRSRRDVVAADAGPRADAGGGAIAWSASAAAGARDIRYRARCARRAGWTPVARAGGVPWTPRFAGADRLLVQRYRDAQGREGRPRGGGLRWQGEGRECWWGIRAGRRGADGAGRGRRAGARRRAGGPTASSRTAPCARC